MPNLYNLYPLLVLGGIIGIFSIIFIVAYATMKNKKEAIGFDRHMKDSEIVKRLLKYAKPHWKSFVGVGFIMLFSIAYDILSPLIVGNVEEMIKDDFPVSDLFIYVGIYAAILIVSLICTYIQAIVLQRTGQKIISRIREDLFDHIQKLSHNQHHGIPVGKLVTRVTNDVEALNEMYTQILVRLIKNIAKIIGLMLVMFMLNAKLALLALCLMPLIVVLTIVFKSISKTTYRIVRTKLTALNNALGISSGVRIL